MGSASRTKGTKRDCRVRPTKTAGTAMRDAAMVFVMRPIVFGVFWMVLNAGKVGLSHWKRKGHTQEVGRRRASDVCDELLLLILSFKG